MAFKKYRKSLENLQLINSQNGELICKIISKIQKAKDEMNSEIEKVNELLISMQKKVINEYKNDIEEFWRNLILMIFLSILPAAMMEFVFRYCELNVGLTIFLRILQFISVFVVFILLKRKIVLSYPKLNRRKSVPYPLYEFKETFIPEIENILSDISFSNNHIIKIKGLADNNIQALSTLENKLMIEREELSAEKDRLLAFSKVISTASLMDINIDLGIISTMLKLKDKGTNTELVINRFKLLEEYYKISLDVFIFVFYLFHDDKRSTTNNWNTIKTDSKLLEELIEVFQDKLILPRVNYDTELQKKIIQQFDIFNVHKAREWLLFGEKLFAEIERITMMLETEGFEVNSDYSKSLIKNVSGSNDNVNLFIELIKDSIDIDSTYLGFVTSALCVLYTDKYRPDFLKNALCILAEETESMELLFLWVLNQENRIYERTFSEIFHEWIEKKEKRRLTFPLDSSRQFKYFIQNVEEGIFSKNIQTLFETSIEKIKEEHPLIIDDLTFKINKTNLRISKLLPTFFVRKISFSSLVRLLKKNELIIYTLNFKSVPSAAVTDVLSELETSINKAGFKTDWKKYLSSSRIGVIEGKYFEDFKEFLNKELRKYKIFEKASFAFNVFLPSEEATLEYGTIEAKEEIKDIMKKTFHLDEEEIVSALKYDLQDYGILDLLREASDELTIGDFIHYSEVKDYLNNDDFKILKSPEILSNLLEELNFSSFFELLLEISTTYEYKEKMRVFFSKIDEFQNASDKISELLYRKLDGIIQEEPHYSRTFQKVRRHIWENLSSNEFLRRTLEQNEKRFDIILMNIINYHTSIIKYMYKQTSKFEKEPEFQNHLYDYLSRPDRIGSQNIYCEDEKSRGRVDFRIYDIPIELKFISNENIDYVKYKEKKVKETKQYIVNREHNLGFLIIMNTTPQEKLSEADIADYYEIHIDYGGRKKEEDTSQFPIGVIIIHLLGGERTQDSRITK